MLSEVFSDSFAHKDNALSRIDARIKMFFVFAGIITILFSRDAQVSAASSFLILISLISVRIPFKAILFRILPPLAMAAVIVGLNLIVYKRGLSENLLIMGKVTGCVSLVIFLSMTTPVNELLGASLWFRIPKTWIEIAAVTYRYVFVLLEDASTIRDAQKVRLGYSNLLRSIQSLAELAGSVFIRAYDQSLATAEAMRMRGYTGACKFFFEKRFAFKDALHLACFMMILFLLIALNLYRR